MKGWGMKKYRVKLEFIYSDVVHVEAKNKEDAVKEALLDCSEEYEKFYDARIREE
jgi:hypothetical protein